MKKISNSWGSNTDDVPKEYEDAILYFHFAGFSNKYGFSAGPVVFSILCFATYTKPGINR